MKTHTAPRNHDVAQQLIKHVHQRLPTYRPPAHPGEMLLRQFLEPMGLSQVDLAKRMGVSYPRVNEIINGKRGITADTALRLARLFHVSADFWLGLQQDWDVWQTIHSDTAPEILKIGPMPLNDDGELLPVQ